MPDTIVRLDAITVPPRLRALRSETVDELALSMQARGLFHPLVLRQREAGGYALVAGRHRLAAARKLGWPEVKAIVFNGMGADAAEIYEIDENLIRADLSPAERKLHIARRKELYEQEHPQTKHGAVGRRGKSSRNENSFVASTAAKTGKGRSTVARDVTHAKRVGVLSDIAHTCLDEETEIAALAKLPEAEQVKLAARAKAGEKVSAKHVGKKLRRAELERELGGRIMALPTKKYGLIVADDEWDHEPWSRETGMDRHASNHFETAKDAHKAEELHERTKARFECAADDCLLAMWSTVQHLAVAIDLLRLRGFKYVSHYAWGKTGRSNPEARVIGLGHWNRNKHELLLLGVRGRVPCPAQGDQWDSLVMAPRGRHSAKPERFLEMLEQYYPTVPKIELNRRGPARKGWSGWGNQAEPPADATLDDIGHRMRELAGGQA